MRKRVDSDLLTYPNDGFASRAFVATRYRVTDGLLHSVGAGVARTYYPFAEVGLPTALARISTGELSPLEFASEFGEMGFDKIIRSSLGNPLSASLPKSAEWNVAKAAYREWRSKLHIAVRTLPGGDPLDWLIAHSKTVALCLEFIGLLSAGDEYAIRDAVESTTKGPYAKRDLMVSLPVQEWRQSLQRGTAPSAIISVQLAHLITENISGVRRWLMTGPMAVDMESSFLCNATIEAVYWQIADRMEAKMVRRCEECKRFFIARDKRQQYCPPLPGSTRSRCSSRQNVRSHRLRQE